MKKSDLKQLPLVTASSLRQPPSAIKPVLVFAYGNLSRGDDALAPLLVENIFNEIDQDRIEILTDFQLQIEHALDLENRKLVLFIDASVACESAFEFCQLQAHKDKSFTTHVMSPAAILHVFEQLKGFSAPACFLLSIQGLSFELGADLSLQANNNLHLATAFAQQLLHYSHRHYWQQAVENNRQRQKVDGLA